MVSEIRQKLQDTKMKVESSLIQPFQKKKEYQNIRNIWYARASPNLWTWDNPQMLHKIKLLIEAKRAEHGHYDSRIPRLNLWR